MEEMRKGVKKEVSKQKLLVVLLLLSLVFVAGCAGQTSTLKNQEEASDAVTDVAADVDKLGSTLQELSNDLGGSFT